MKVDKVNILNGLAEIGVIAGLFLVAFGAGVGVVKDLGKRLGKRRAEEEKLAEGWKTEGWKAAREAWTRPLTDLDMLAVIGGLEVEEPVAVCHGSEQKAAEVGGVARKMGWDVGRTMVGIGMLEGLGYVAVCDMYLVGEGIAKDSGGEVGVGVTYDVREMTRGKCGRCGRAVAPQYLWCDGCEDLVEREGKTGPFFRDREEVEDI